ELLVADRGEAGRFEARLEIEDIDQADKMHARHIDSIPPLALRIFSVAREISLSVVGIGNVVLARYVKHLLVGRFDDLIGVVPLLFLGEVADVAGVDEEGGLRRHRLDLVDRLAERGARVGVWRQMKANMAVTNLNESKRAPRRPGGGSPADQAAR